ncbi:MAG: hypothetical protein DRP96_00125 [Candidatus Neomarinimicrobiota bacterium]|nr:MAG: hypothetical protein DRP96_00125 [Candidatus Neomarinimicrobiota bacterium]
MKTSRSTLSFRIEYFCLRGLTDLLPRLSHSARRRLAGVIGTFWYRILLYRRKTVRRNLMNAFPEQSPAWHKQIQRRCFQTIARIYLDIFAGFQLDNKSFQQMFNPIDLAPLETALKEGKGVLILSFHFGNWELAADWLVRQGYTLAAIAARLANPLADRLITAIRTRNGLQILPKGRRHTVRTFRFLRNNHLLYMISDQNAGRKGVWVRFFGQWASSFRGPALFALRKKCPVILTTCLMDRNGRYTIKFDKLSTDTPNSMNEDQKIQHLVQSYTSYFEKLIRENPEQYYWVHRRWKTKAPEYLKKSGD